MRIAAFAATCLVLAAPCLTAFAADEATNKAVAEVQALSKKVDGFQADVEAQQKQGKQEVTMKFSLSVSRQYGWKWSTTEGPGGERVIYNDFKTSYDYYPKAKKAIKLVALNAKMEQDFRKPVEGIDLLSVVDPQTIKLVGSETLDNEPVYHFEGTTTTQIMEFGKPVKTQVDSWVSKKDGLARKTVEKMDDALVSTLYKNVKVTPGFKTEDFKFTPPEGVEVLDYQKEMQSARERARTGRAGERATSAPQQQGQQKPVLEEKR